MCLEWSSISETSLDLPEVQKGHHLLVYLRRRNLVTHMSISGFIGNATSDGRTNLVQVGRCHKILQQVFIVLK